LRTAPNPRNQRQAAEKRAGGDKRELNPASSRRRSPNLSSARPPWPRHQDARCDQEQQYRSWIELAFRVRRDRPVKWQPGVGGGCPDCAEVRAEPLDFAERPGEAKRL